jgi:hypothetical protein
MKGTHPAPLRRRTSPIVAVFAVTAAVAVAVFVMPALVDFAPLTEPERVDVLARHADDASVALPDDYPTDAPQLSLTVARSSADAAAWTLLYVRDEQSVADVAAELAAAGYSADTVVDLGGGAHRQRFTGGYPVQLLWSTDELIDELTMRVTRPDPQR